MERYCLLLAIALYSTLPINAETPPSQFSPLSEINRDNVSQMRLAWTYRTGEPTSPLPGRDTTPAFEATPVYAAGLLYIGTPYGKAIALDPETGKERWSFDAKINRKGNYGDFANRGVSYWADASGERDGRCTRRIFFASIDARLFALDARTGALCRDFGAGGRIDLTRGLRRGPEYVGEYQQTSPPAVIGDLVIRRFRHCRQQPGQRPDRRSARVRCAHWPAALEMGSAGRDPRGRRRQRLVPDSGR